MTSDDDLDFDGDDLISEDGADLTSTPDSTLEASLDLNDFDDDFDDDFEAEVTGEYDMDDDEFARQLVDMVDFEIEGLAGSDPKDLLKDDHADVDDE